MPWEIPVNWVREESLLIAHLLWSAALDGFPPDKSSRSKRRSEREVNYILELRQHSPGVSWKIFMGSAMRRSNVIDSLSFVSRVQSVWEMKKCGWRKLSNFFGDWNRLGRIGVYQAVKGRTDESLETIFFLYTSFPLLQSYCWEWFIYQSIGMIKLFKSDDNKFSLSRSRSRVPRSEVILESLSGRNHKQAFITFFSRNHPLGEELDGDDKSNLSFLAFE